MKNLVTTVVFLRRNNEILLAMKKRDHGKGRWNGPGGKVDSHETVEQAMIRECQEEIGVTPIKYERVAESVFYQLYKGEPCKNTGHIYFCTEWTGEPIESDEMIPQWFNIDEIPYSQMWPDTPYCIPQLLAGKKLRGTFRYNDDDSLQTYELTEVEGF